MIDLIGDQLSQESFYSFIKGLSNSLNLYQLIRFIIKTANLVNAQLSLKILHFILTTVETK